MQPNTQLAESWQLATAVIIIFFLSSVPTFMFKLLPLLRLMEAEHLRFIFQAQGRAARSNWYPGFM